MVELGIWPNAKQVNLDERLTRSVMVVAGTRFLWVSRLIIEE
jgi:hypothetical protein